MNYDEKIEELFIDLPELRRTSHSTVHAVKVGKLLYINGILPYAEGKIITKGRVGLEIDLDSAKRAARAAAINALSIIKHECEGTLNKIKRFISLTGYIASGGEFKNHFKVLDGAAELFIQIYGHNAKHTINAVGCTCLPENACVELSLIVELK